jgi:hypothetical protein
LPGGRHAGPGDFAVDTPQAHVGYCGIASFLRNPVKYPCACSRRRRQETCAAKCLQAYTACYVRTKNRNQCEQVRESCIKQCQRR